MGGNGVDRVEDRLYSRDVAEVGGLQQVTAQLKEILSRPVHREKPLRVGGGFEPLRLAR